MPLMAMRLVAGHRTHYSPTRTTPVMQLSRTSASFEVRAERASKDAGRKWADNMPAHNRHTSEQIDVA